VARLPMRRLAVAAADRESGVCVSTASLAFRLALTHIERVHGRRGGKGDRARVGACARESTIERESVRERQRQSSKETRARKRARKRTRKRARERAGERARDGDGPEHTCNCCCCCIIIICCCCRNSAERRCSCRIGTSSARKPYPPATVPAAA